MTERRGFFSPRSPRAPRLLSSLALAVATVVSASLLTGCGSLQKASADPKAPVVVMTWAPEGTEATNAPGMPAMARAYARWINAHGGLDGRDLRVLTCNEHNETVSAGRCARRAVAHDVAAVVGSYSQYGRTFMSRLEMAGIPYIGGYGLTDEEFTSPLSYPVNGGLATLLAGNGHQLGRVCRQVSLVRPDTIAGDEMPSLLNAGLLRAKHRPVNDVRAPEDATEYTAQAQKVLEAAGSDPSIHGAPGYGASSGGACVTAALGDRTDTFFDSFRRLQPDRPKMRIASVLGSVQQSLVTRTGGRSSPFEGAYVTGWYPPADDPRWEPMREVIRRQAFGDNSIDPADPGVQTTWIAYQVLRAAVGSLGDRPVTAQSLQRALDGRIGRDGISTGGLTPRLSWRYEDLPAVRDYPRIANSMVTYQQVRDGRLVSARKGFVDVTRTLEQRPSEG